MCMEGTEQNPVVYELMSEMAFRSEKVQLLVIIDFQLLLITCFGQDCYSILILARTIQ